MKPRVHLLCNAHIDPVWLWRRNEGAAEAISTFRAAADFCEKYDGFVFNHNEALLYEWVEEYEPELFERIKKLVKDGKWKIMGGWYLQPDCQMISGESFIRQIEYGRRYFEEKFSVKPTIAVNFDPFGHSRGLVQLLQKTGYRGYVFMRTGPYHYSFKWKGFDGSEVVGHRIYGGYNSLRGEAAKKIEYFLDDYVKNPDNDVKSALVTWGVGNHGGGASVADIEDILKLTAGREDAELIQSDLESFFDEIDTGALPIKEESIEHCMVGCYTSMARIKQLHRRLENRIGFCEKISAHASHMYGTEFGDNLEKARKKLMFSQFHDILPGSCVRPAEEEAVAMLDCGLSLADEQIEKAFFALCAGQCKPGENEIPIMVYNPHPYPIREDISAEFCLAGQNWNADEYTVGEVYDENGNPLPTQNEQPASSLNLDWRKKIVFSAELAPFTMNRFNCRLSVVKNREKIMPYDSDDEYITVKRRGSTVKISKKTGLIESYTKGGTEFLKNAGAISVIEDSEDPWGMTVDRFDRTIGKMKLMTAEAANAFCGYPEEKNDCVRVIENGAVRMVVQAFFEYQRSIAVIKYIIPKNSDSVDISVKMLANDCNRMFKLLVPTVFDDAEYVGQTAFGTQKLAKGGEEVVFHQWCGLRDADRQVCVINADRYGGSGDGKTIEISLLRTPVYSAHPIPERQIVEKNRYTPHIDMGERDFDFRIICGDEELKCDSEAAEFNMLPEALSFFPGGNGTKPTAFAELDNKNIIMSAAKAADNGKYVIRLYNSSAEKQRAKLKVMGICEEISLGRFEVKAYIAENGRLLEGDILGNRK